MVSTRTINRNRKIEMLKESLYIIVEMLLMEKREIEAGNMAYFKRIVSDLKCIKQDAERYGKSINQEKEILSNG